MLGAFAVELVHIIPGAPAGVHGLAARGEHRLFQCKHVLSLCSTVDGDTDEIIMDKSNAHMPTPTHALNTRTKH